MTKMLDFGDDESKRLEAVYTTPDVVAQRRAVMDLLANAPGEQVLDIGVGPGFLAADIAVATGPAGRVCGIDISESMLALARRRAATASGAEIELAVGSAVDIPYPNASFDVAVSTQVLEYVADIPAALSEIRRVLRPGGRVLLLDTDWDSIVWRSSDRDRMERLLRVWEQHLADPHLPRTLKVSLERAGFEVGTVTVVPLLNVGYEPATYSAGMLEIVADFVLGREAVASDEVEQWRADLISLGSEYFFSLNRYVFVATKRY